jgi:tRNA pseudouridine13 synthase
VAEMDKADKVDEREKRVGIQTFITSTPGINGTIKIDPSDFHVEEVTKLNFADNGRYVVIRVRKYNWDTLNFVRVLSNALGISQKRIGYAGTKDKKAETVQYFTIYGGKDLRNVKAIEERLNNIKIKDSEIEVLGESNSHLQLGHLIGNNFRIKVRGIGDGDSISATTEELTEKGIPNFFGLQRFGTIRYITHQVGKLILLGDFKEALWTYVAKPFEGEREEVRQVRGELWESRDVKLGLRELPKYLRYERLMLQKLREGKSEEEALLSLPKNLKMMFIHAYQSYLFNKLLSLRIQEFGTLRHVEKGDFVDFFMRAQGYLVNREDYTEVTGLNLKRIRFLVSERRAFLCLPLPGYETELSGWSGEKLKEILEEEQVELGNFKNKYDEFSSRGSYRCAEIPFDFSVFSFILNELNNHAEFSFFLPKGCYATVFLREYVKEPLV